jgi:hypothetical protein
MKPREQIWFTRAGVHQSSEGNTDCSLSGSYTDVTRGPETRYYAASANYMHVSNASLSAPKVVN